jgi:hypothetical protein
MAHDKKISAAMLKAQLDIAKSIVDLALSCGHYGSGTNGANKLQQVSADLRTMGQWLTEEIK